MSITGQTPGAAAAEHPTKYAIIALGFTGDPRAAEHLRPLEGDTASEDGPEARQARADIVKQRRL